MPSDRVTLSEADVTKLATAICEWHEDPNEVGDYDVPCDACLVQARCTAGVYASIVAARVAEALREAASAVHLVVQGGPWANATDRMTIDYLQDWRGYLRALANEYDQREEA